MHSPGMSALLHSSCGQRWPSGKACGRPLLNITPGIALGIGPPGDLRKLGLHQLPDIRLVIASRQPELQLVQQRPPQRRLARTACPSEAH